MALADHKPQTTPAFETETATMTDTAAAVAEAPAVTAAVTANVPAPVAAQAPAVAAPRAKFEMALADAKDQFPIEAVVGLSRSVPRIKGEQGACYVGEKPLGDKIRMTVESWGIRHLITCGLDNKDAGYKESMDYLANSYDGITVEGKGATIDEYVSYLKSIGYEKAGVSKYGDIFGMVTWTSKDGTIAPADQVLHLLQASQTSLGNFTAFCTTQGLLKSKGISSDLSEIEVHAVARSKGTLKFTNFDFLVVKK